MVVSSSIVNKTAFINRILTSYEPCITPVAINISTPQEEEDKMFY